MKLLDIVCNHMGDMDIPKIAVVGTSQWIVINKTVSAEEMLPAAEKG